MKHGFSERRVCRALNQSWSTQRYVPQPRSDEGLLTQDILRLASQYGRYGYRRISRCGIYSCCRYRCAQRYRFP